ncbi:hemin-degrading factor [Halopseudomonas bauzanensis]|uniref:Putative hemin transport protein n=1 Tax=Halopseudomonas bauzanensis TaxID=653930 RepID=A0A1H9SY02_9GAMM|nr:ChuX/HutX family heme-like substrate-binding protein [Halopseudomonas bauzanensis]SER89902.1 putative hemin transport protein [Halopseudomonas bauzanensis]SFL91338.1 putative hemin transport protein [Halopseudomonas bauzanensis]
MTLQAQSATPTSPLFEAWQQLLQQQPRLRTRDVAEQLAVSEAELIASRLGIDTLRLRPEWAQLLPALEGLGRVMVLTRNAHCVHERKGVYRETTVAGSGKMGLVVSPDIDLRLFLSGWHSLFAVEQTTTRGLQRSLQVFDQQGMAIHKVFLTEQSDLDTWGQLLSRFAEADQSAQLDLQPAPIKQAERVDSEVDTGALAEDWRQLKDVHHFHAMLNRNKVGRLQALRLIGREWAEPLATQALPTVMTEAAAQQLPIMVFVGNRHCIQIHTGPVHELRWVGDWFNVLDADFNLHLKMPAVAHLWRVRKPSSDGVITSWEAYDADGELILQLFGARKPGQPELESWRTLAELTPALEA